MLTTGKKFLSKLILVISNLIYNYRLKRWIKHKGDQQLRINYKLNNNSIVFDVGGYLGDWTDSIYSKYKCKVLVFEPVKKYYQKIVNKFKNKQKIHVYNIGLGTQNAKKYIYLMDNSSSFYKIGDNVKKQLCEIMDIEKFISKNKIKHVDLIKINIEGGEYDLLEKMITSKLINKFENLQIQFHRFIPDAKLRRKEIQTKLARTHYLTYNYPFIWENWQRKT